MTKSDKNTIKKNLRFDQIRKIGNFIEFDKAESTTCYKFYCFFQMFEDDNFDRLENVFFS